MNVIESTEERNAALSAAWELARQVLIVSARLKHEVAGQVLVPFADGYVTARGTFQKFFDHSELQEWISAGLGVDPVPASPGVFYVFRDSGTRESYLAQRVRRRGPRLSAVTPEHVYDRYRPLFEGVLPFFSVRGRLPSVAEVPPAAELYSAIPRIDDILGVLRVAVGATAFDAVVAERRQDLLVYLALSRFSKRPQLGRLPMDLQLDVRSFFPTYFAACAAADSLLFQVGDKASLDTAFRESTVGKVTPNGLYVHSSALQRLPALLRLYEGCAKAYVGAVIDANVVKLHRLRFQVSYLSYPDFDRVPHPALTGSLVVDLRRPDLRYFDYVGSEDPSILHRKELMVPEDYPRRALFAALTRQEENRGLYENTASIGRANGWRAVLSAKGYTLRGHRLIRS